MTIVALFALLIFCNAFFIYKYLKLKKGLKSYEKIGTGRCGFYKYTGGYSVYNAYVYVIEIDRYTDGYSKIKIDRIEPLDKRYNSEANEKSKDSFISLRLTNEIEWLESEDHIKRLRKEKLDQINKI
jgi:hypothetical protein